MKEWKKFKFTQKLKKKNGNKCSPTMSLTWREREGWVICLGNLFRIKFLSIFNLNLKKEISCQGKSFKMDNYLEKTAPERDRLRPGRSRMCIPANLFWISFLAKYKFGTLRGRGSGWGESEWEFKSWQQILWWVQFK